MACEGCSRAREIVSAAFALAVEKGKALLGRGGVSRYPRQQKRWLATNDAQWIRIRDRHLAKEPTCRQCGAGHSLEVDHIDGRCETAHDYRDENLQTLCSTCHAAKTAVENGSFGHKPGTTRRQGCDAQGRPLDPDHHWKRR